MGLEKPTLQQGDETETSHQQSSTETPAVEESQNPKPEEIVTVEVLQNIVKEYNPELSLLAWKGKLGTKPGDNFLSILYAVEIELKGKAGNETVNVMLKTVPSGGYRVDMLNEIQLFRKEATIYKDVLSLLEKIQEEKGISNKEMLRAWPKCYAARVDGLSDYLAMQDLKVPGYKMGNRKIGLNFNHCASALRSLAKFHAISFALYNGNQQKLLDDFPVLINRMFGNEDNKISDMQKQMFPQTFKSLAATLKEMGEDLASSRLQKITDADIVGSVNRLLSKKVDAAVITHGDFWVNNMLFKYNDKDTVANCPSDVMFIDFQLCQASSRLIDVYYFLLTSVQLGVLKEREEDLLMTYYSEFTSFAEKMGVNTSERGLTWKKFQEEANEYRFYGICMGIFFAPIFEGDEDNVPDMDSIKQEDFSKNAEDGSSETKAVFFKDVKQSTMAKVKYILLEQLPKWSGCAPYL